MNYVVFGRQRRAKIANTIYEGKAFTRYQIQKLFFSEQKASSSKRKAQEILAKLVGLKEIKKLYKDDHATPSVYYVEKKPINLVHALSINDVYVALLEQKNPEQTIEWKWSYSINNGMVIADAYINIYWDIDKKHRQVIFLEIECDPRKKFNKDSQYQKIWEIDWNKTLPEWVVVDIDSKKAIFPKILIVTDKDLRFESGLKFILATPEQVQNDIYSLIKEEIKCLS